jgi:uncharacterized protein YdaU (DUF1376 family)
MSLPYIPLYVDDYEAATAHLSLIEDGIYNRLLRLCWRTPGCKLPNDRDWIARKIRVSSDGERASLELVLSEFFTVKRGAIFSKRLRAEYEQASVTVRKRKEAGKSGGLAKSLKTVKIDPSKATVGLQQPEPEPEPEPIEKPNGFSKRASAQKPPGFVRVRKTTDALNDFLQEILSDERGTEIRSDGDWSDVPMLPAVRAG